MKYPVLIHKESSSDFGVTVPDLPGCYSAGTTMEEALESAQEAILTHVEGLLMDQEPIGPGYDGFANIAAIFKEVGARAAILVVTSIYLLSFAWTGVVHELLTLGSGVLGL